jgi:hypothetical protein
MVRPNSSEWKRPVREGLNAVTFYCKGGTFFEGLTSCPIGAVHKEYFVEKRQLRRRLGQVGLAKIKLKRRVRDQKFTGTYGTSVFATLFWQADNSYSPHRFLSGIVFQDHVVIHTMTPAKKKTGRLHHSEQRGDGKELPKACS